MEASAAPSVEPTDGRTLAIGAEVAGRYRVIGCLNSGGMGSVYEVLDKRTDRLRALKVMLPDVATDADMRARFEREASVVGRVRSDHIVEVVDAGISEPNTPFLVMERLHGEDLATLLARRGKLPPGEVVTMLAQVASGLDKIHEEGVIHRDLKLENLFVTKRDDGSALIKIVDFGVAKMIDYAKSLSTTRSLGTPLFMAPEQLTGDGAIGPAADLYALAHAAFCMLAGRPYWFREADEAATPYAFISVVVKGASESARERARRLDVTLPPGFDAWFAKATDKRPARRFESARDQIAALATALGVDAPAELPAPKRARRFSPALAALAGAAIVGIGLVPLLCSASRPAAEQPAPPETGSPSAVALSNAIAPALAQPSVESSAVVDVRSNAGAAAATTPENVASERPRAASARPARVPSASKTAPYDPLDEP